MKITPGNFPRYLNARRSPGTLPYVPGWSLKGHVRHAKSSLHVLLGSGNIDSPSGIEKRTPFPFSFAGNLLDFSSTPLLCLTSLWVKFPLSLLHLMQWTTAQTKNEKQPSARIHLKWSLKGHVRHAKSSLHVLLGLTSVPRRFCA
jgi:hypothetical protein